MEILYSPQPRAGILTVSAGDQSTVAAIPTALEAAEGPVHEQAVALRDAATSFATHAAHVVQTYTPAARIGQLRDLALRTFAKPVQNLIAGGQAEARAIAAAWARLIAVPVADASTANIRNRDVSAFLALSIDDKVRWIEGANVDQLGALIEVGRSRFSDLPPQIWDRAENRYAALNFVRMAGTAADYARQPTLEDPIATGVDMEAAEAAAFEGLKRHRQKNDVIKDVREAVQGITAVVAVTCGMNAEVAFTMLTTGKLPE